MATRKPHTAPDGTLSWSISDLGRTLSAPLKSTAPDPLQRAVAEALHAFGNALNPLRILVEPAIRSSEARETFNALLDRLFAADAALRAADAAHLSQDDGHGRRRHGRGCLMRGADLPLGYYLDERTATQECERWNARSGPDAVYYVETHALDVTSPDPEIPTVKPKDKDP